MMEHALDHYSVFGVIRHLADIADLRVVVWNRKKYIHKMNFLPN